MTTVKVGTVAAAVTVTDAQHLAVTVPAGTPGQTVDVIVTTSAGTVTKSGAFTYPEDE